MRAWRRLWVDRFGWGCVGCGAALAPPWKNPFRPRLGGPRRPLRLLGGTKGDDRCLSSHRSTPRRSPPSPAATRERASPNHHARLKSAPAAHAHVPAQWFDGLESSRRRLGRKGQIAAPTRKNRLRLAAFDKKYYGKKASAQLLSPISVRKRRLALSRTSLVGPNGRIQIGSRINPPFFSLARLPLAVAAAVAPRAHTMQGRVPWVAGDTWGPRTIKA